MLRNNLRLIHRLSSKQQPKVQQTTVSEKDFDKSFEDFAKKYSLSSLDQVQQKQGSEKIIFKAQQQKGQEHKNINQNLQQQTQSLKNKILGGKCKEYKEKVEQYGLLGRGEQVFLNHKKIEQEDVLLKQHNELQKLEEGEEGIDYVMLSEQYMKESYFAKAYGHRRIDEAYRSQEGYPQLSSKTKYSSIAQWREMNYGFQPIQKQYEAHPNLQYPGSVNGPEPEDDPVAFRDWYVKNYPKKVVDEMYELAQSLMQQPKDVDLDEIIEMPTETYTGAHEAIQPSTNIGLLDNDVEGEMMSSPHQWVFRSIIKDNDIEPLPDKLPVDPIQLFDQIEKWSHFRWLSLVVRCAEVIKQGSKPKQIPRLTSLYPYYCTLPKFAREHPSVKIAYKNLEFKKFSLSIEEKERALNFVCQATLQMDELTDAVCHDLSQTRRHHPTVDDEKILIHENDKDIIDGYVNPLARDKYLATKPMYPDLEQKEGDYPYPYPQRFVTEEKDLTPVDFYDNDDGFWDEYIKQKHEYYISNHRPSTSRQFFKH